MSEPTLTGTFGAGTTQNETSITILKSNLTGLTPSAENTAEQIISALTLKLATTLSEANQISNPDQQVVVKDVGYTENPTRNDKNYKRIIYTFWFEHEDETGGLNPHNLDPNKY